MRGPRPRRGGFAGALAGAALVCAVTRGAFAAPADEVAAHAWVVVRGPHVEVVTDAGREVGERVARQLEDLHAVFTLAAPGLVAPTSRVQVLVFRDAPLFDAYAPRWRGVRDELGGYFLPGSDRRRLLFADRPGRTLAVAQHEFTHALLEASLPEAPLWLNEGLAEYWSTFRAADGAGTAGAPVAAHLEWLERNEPMPLARLFAIAQGSPEYHEGDRRGTFYAQSWALVHLLLTDDDDLGRLGRCLTAFRDGAPFDESFARAFGHEAALLERLQAHLGRTGHVLREWPLPRSGPRLESRPLPPAAVLASLGNALLAHDPPQREPAREHLRRALRLDPGNTEAIAGLGWLELLGGRPDSARALFRRALRAVPVSAPAVRLVASEWLPAASGTGAVARAAFVAALREALGRARRAEPGDPELVALLARTWVVEPGDDAEPGYRLAREAAEALPGRSDVRLDLVALAALTGRLAEARALAGRWFAGSPREDARESVRRSLFAGEAREADALIEAGRYAAADSLLRAARARVAGDARLTQEADAYLAQLAKYRRERAAVDAENLAVREYNAGVELANRQRPREAAEAFRRAGRAAASDSMRARSREMAERMQVRWRGEEALALARSGREAEAIARLEALLAPGLGGEERRWIEQNLALLRERQRR